MTSKDNKPKKPRAFDNPLGPSSSTPADRKALKDAQAWERKLRKNAVEIKVTPIMNGFTVKYIQPEQ